jgi:hypothetical protein
MRKTGRKMAGTSTVIVSAVQQVREYLGPRRVTSDGVTAWRYAELRVELSTIDCG